MWWNICKICLMWAIFFIFATIYNWSREAITIKAVIIVWRWILVSIKARCLQLSSALLPATVLRCVARVVRWQRYRVCRPFPPQRCCPAVAAAVWLCRSAAVHVALRLLVALLQEQGRVGAAGWLLDSEPRGVADHSELRADTAWHSAHCRTVVRHRGIYQKPDAAQEVRAALPFE